MSIDSAAAGGDREQRIREVAYLIWMEEGCPHGRDQEHWARACEKVAAEDTPQQPVKTAKTKPPAKPRNAPAKR